jgi:hypothetical protein
MTMGTTAKIVLATLVAAVAATGLASESSARARFHVFIGGPYYVPPYPAYYGYDGPVYVAPPRGYYNNYYYDPGDYDPDLPGQTAYDFDDDYYEPQYDPRYQPPRGRPLSAPNSGAAAKPLSIPTKEPAAISCSKAGKVISGYGFGDIKSVDCQGQVYAFNAKRDGKRYAIKLNAVSGELTEVKKL